MLVPLYSLEDAGSTVQKAIEIANQWVCNVHLLFIEQGHAITDDNVFDTARAHIQSRYQHLLSPSLSLYIKRQQSQEKKEILQYYYKNKIDLILLGSKKRPFGIPFCNANAVSVCQWLRTIKCPVLNIYSEPDISVIKNIVLPVGEFMPMQKLLFATYLAKSSHSTIHLVSVSGKSGRSNLESVQNLYKSYRLLRENTSLQVECGTAPGGNIATVTWTYAKKIKADLILVNAGKESLLSGFLNGLFAKFLFNVSRIPVMTLSV